ncbi:MAG: MFS transporter [Akkermansiaceae bacterium]|nr:MFS transporter [Akkermansiaceae bacterium]MBJ7424197.1 MFS transporter [Akkermansiaceae bacterium]
MSESPAASRTQITYFYELWRSAAAGIIETAGTTFLLTIAVKQFAAGSVSKGVVAGSGSLGLLLSLLVVSLVKSKGWRTGKAASWILAIGAVGFLLASLLPYLSVFVCGCMIGMAASSAIIPLLTQMYHENYPEDKRGQFFSRTVMVRIAMAAGFSKLAGDALSGHIAEYRWLLLVFSVALVLASFCLARCPTTPILSDGGTNPFRALRFVRDDALFRRTLICWMFMGFANLMMIPLRVEYLANPKYSVAATVGMIALLTGVIPNLARLILSPVWGYLFDHMNFFLLRVLLNFGFAIGILTFFASDSLTGLVIGAIIFGISNSGGDVAWGLWVTKFAPPGHVADYMSVHTFLTGIRGVLAPLIAFQVAAYYSLGGLACCSSALIVLATLMLIPEVRWKRKNPMSV